MNDTEKLNIIENVINDMEIHFKKMCDDYEEKTPKQNAMYEAKLSCIKAIKSNIQISMAERTLEAMEAE